MSYVGVLLPVHVVRKEIVEDVLMLHTWDVHQYYDYLITVFGSEFHMKK